MNTIFKKKLSDEQLSNIFVNGVLEAIDNGFDEVVSFIKEDSVFVSPPPFSNVSDGHFTMIVLVGNIHFLGENFEPDQAVKLEELVKEKLAGAFEMEVDDFNSYLKEYKTFISRVNHPSKNMLYGMSKAMFHKYKLNDYQDDYFKKTACPNPLFLKRMDEVMENFIWSWDEFFKRFKMVS